MPNIAIRVEGLGKRYRIGAAAARHDALLAALASAVKTPLRNLSRLRGLTSFSDADEDGSFWALREVSFQLERGEVLGIIGRNGAGKSTLLKLLSRITEPSAGHADVWGRVGSLLEVGTGFHPELTGRENIYLNGSILGMDRRSIDVRFDEIVDFAGVEKFIDTPVKRYSSGMYLRLAFAVAAHLEPEVLIVDEVLAVGDAEFQKKCIGRMDEVARQGRTVLFVSHNLAAVQRLCSRAILLSEGRVVADGETAEVVKRYLATDAPTSAATRWIELSAPRERSGVARLLAARYGSPDPDVDHWPYPGGPLEICVKVSAAQDIPRATIGCILRDQYGTTLLAASNQAVGTFLQIPAGTTSWSLRFPTVPLRPGAYQVDLWVGDSFAVQDKLQPAFRLEIVERESRGSLNRFNPRYDGMVFCEYQIARADAVAASLDETGSPTADTSVSTPVVTQTK